MALTFGVWAYFAEERIRKLQGQLLISEQENKDAEIVAKVHALSDDDLDAEFAKDMGGSKPSS